MELPGGSVGRCDHAAAAVRSGKTAHVIEFGGLNLSYTKLAATTILQMCKYMVVGGGGGGSVSDSAPYEY